MADNTWQELYKAVILETDDEKLPKQIQSAMTAINRRVQALQLSRGGAPEERQAICNAFAGLNVLRGELQARSHGFEQHLNGGKTSLT